MSQYIGFTSVEWECKNENCSKSNDDFVYFDKELLTLQKWMNSIRIETQGLLSGHWYKPLTLEFDIETRGLDETDDQLRVRIKGKYENS